MLKERKIQQLSLASLMIIREVIKKKNLTEAARGLGISQPAVSQQLARFEKIIGYPIIVRRGNDLILKDDAAALAIDQVVAGMEALLRATQSASQNARRPRLGISPFIFDKIITIPKVRRCLTENFDIFVEASNTLRDEFQKIDLDLVFRAVATNENESDLLHESKLHWLTSSTKQVGQNQLDGIIPLLLGSERSIISDQVEMFLQEKQIPFIVSMRLSTHALRLRAVSTGIGFTVIPTFLKDKTLDHKNDVGSLECDTTLPDLPNIYHGLFYHKKMISYNDALSVFELIIHALDDVA